MTVYAIAQLKFTDRAAYDRYQAWSVDVFRRHQCTVLSADTVVLPAKGME